MDDGKCANCLHKNILQRLLMFCLMPTAPIFHFNISHLAEAPYFVKRPEDTVAVAGADVTLDCQVSGETKRGSDV